jgi:hypothetical protein
MTTPPPLNYAPPPSLPPGRNRWWKVLLRILAGMAAGTASAFLGWLLVAVTGFRLGALFFLPPILLLTAAIVVAVRFRRFGYVTGILLAPVIIGIGLVILLLILCSGGTPSFH